MAPQNPNLRSEGEKCTHCKKLGHNHEKCWFKHSHLRPNRRASEKGGDRDGNNRGGGFLQTASLAGSSGSGGQDQMQQLFQQFSMWYAKKNMDGIALNSIKSNLINQIILDSTVLVIICL